MADNISPSSDRPDWYTKARSRAWVKDRKSLHDVPTAALLTATFAYVGLSPVASGTVASAVAAIIYYILHGLQNPFALAIACVIVLVAGIWAGGVVERSLKLPDPGIVVIDEVLGQWIALLTWIYAGDLLYVIIAFLAFRFFDIVKLWPAKIFEERPGGAGIMLDDAVAGVYANFAAHLAMIGIRHFV